jgi:hypothetical protein
VPQACKDYWATNQAALLQNENRAQALDAYPSSTKRLTRKQLSEMPIVKMKVL